jgi:hypothetical protein
MKMKELMERVGERRFNLVKAYAKDAITEIQQITKENMDSIKTDLVAGKSRYDLPPFMIRLGGVKVLDKKTNTYKPIPRIYETNIEEGIS